MADQCSFQRIIFQGGLVCPQRKSGVKDRHLPGLYRNTWVDIMGIFPAVMSCAFLKTSQGRIQEQEHHFGEKKILGENPKFSFPVLKSCLLILIFIFEIRLLVSQTGSELPKDDLALLISCLYLSAGVTGVPYHTYPLCDTCNQTQGFSQHGKKQAIN